MNVNFLPLLPAVQVLLTALIVLIRDLFISERESRGYLAFISLLGIGLAVAESLALWGGQQGAFDDTLMLDSFALYFSLIFLLAAALTILSSIQYLRLTAIHEGEFYALVLFATVGMMIMAAANDLLVFFLGLETMSIAVYVLTGMWRASDRATEAAMKYFFIGAFATGFLLYGIALIYGATGSTHLNVIADALVEQPSQWPAYLIGGGLLLLVGFAFKVGAVPFHFWVPDVYEGAPTPVTGFMAVAVKAAAFAAWARVLLHKLSALDSDWVFPLWLIAIGTMTLGNLLALTQSSVKRMLAYSSIAHAGYLLIAIVVGEEWGGLPLLFYVASYALMTVGAFAVLTSVADGDGPNENYASFAGLGFKRPFLGAGDVDFYVVPRRVSAARRLRREVLRVSRRRVVRLYRAGDRGSAQQLAFGGLLPARDRRDVHGRRRSRRQELSPGALRLYCDRIGARRHDLPRSAAGFRP